MPAPSAQRLEDADVAGFFHHDHEEHGQDAEAGHRDDDEQQHVENGGFHLHGGQQGALLVAPGVDAVDVRGESLARSRSRTASRSAPGLSLIWMVLTS